MESYKHEYAKETVVRWLNDANRKWCKPDSGRVFTEYPVCVDTSNEVHGLGSLGLAWDEVDTFDNKVPTYEQCVGATLLPLVIFDVVSFHKAPLRYAFEIVHRHGISPEKRAYIHRFWKQGAHFHLYVLDADWVLSQCGLPSQLECMEKQEWKL